MTLKSLPLNFVTDGALGQVLCDHFQHDAANAKLSWKFKIYYRLRPYIPIPLRQMLQRNRTVAMDIPSDWFYHKAFINDWNNALQAELKEDDRLLIHPWPDGHSACSVLTHDVETQDGVALVPALAELEEKHGFRSAWNFIPYKYDIDDGLLRDLKARGHEIGVHGYNHDGRLFLSRRLFRSRVPKINEAARRFAATGFRTPMVHRNLDWQQEIEVDYDATCFDVDPFQAMPGGVGGVWPFVAGRFVELPYTLPQDHTMMIVLGEKTPRIWIEKLEFIRKLRGMAMLVTHPDYLDTQERLGIYRQWLMHLREQDGLWHCLPQDVSVWWRAREASKINDLMEITGPAANRGQIARLSELWSVV